MDALLGAVEGGPDDPPISLKTEAIAVYRLMRQQDRIHARRLSGQSARELRFDGALELR